MPMWISRHSSLSKISGIIRTGYRYNDLADWIESRDISMGLVQAESSLVIRSVPRTLRVENEEAYTPTDVCIGLLHRGKSTSLEEMEKEKELIYMCSLFQRTRNPEQTKVECVAALHKMENTLRSCYPGVLNELDVVFAVLVDSCFIIELLYRHYTHEYTEQYDPILEDPLRKFEVQRDLLLLENQIPFSALEELFKLTVNRFHNHEHDHDHDHDHDHVLEPVSILHTTPQPLSLSQCVLSFFDDIMGTGDNISLDKQWELGRSPLHILHFLHMCYNPGGREMYGNIVMVPSDIEEHPCSYKPTATQRFRTPYLFPWKSGKLEIPRFSVSNITDSFLRNLMAFEHFSPWVGTFFTSHAFLMDVLIDSVEDVKLLEEAGIINNRLGSTDSIGGQNLQRHFQEC